MNTLPETGFLRLHEITGDPKKGIPGILPIARSTWLEGVRLKRYPQPYKFPKNIIAWRVEDIRQMIEDAAPPPEVPAITPPKRRHRHAVGNGSACDDGGRGW